MGRNRTTTRWIRYPQVGAIFVLLCCLAVGFGLRARTVTHQAVHIAHDVTRPFHLGPAAPNCIAQPCVALSFDDGPDSTTTLQIVDILANEHVHATFFVIGNRVQGREAVLHQEYAGGNEIGDHSWSHPDLTTLPPSQVEDQISMAQAAISGAGVPAPTLLRPPYGAVNDTVLTHVHLAIAMWDVDTDDWEQRNPAIIDQNLLSHVHPGAIVLMHDIYPTTVAALDPAIQALKAEHYQFVTISQLYNLSPGDHGQFFGHPANLHE